MATGEWHYSKDDEKTGPVSSGDLRQLASDGTLLPDDMVWKEGWADWKPAKSIKGLFPQNAPPPPTPAKTRKAPDAIRAATQAADDVSKKLWFLDLKFEQFATPRLIGFVFVASLLMLAVAGAGVIGYGFLNDPVIEAAFTSVVVLFILVFLAVGMRVFLEGCLVVFRIAEHLSHLQHLNPQSGESDA